MSGPNYQSGTNDEIVAIVTLCGLPPRSVNPAIATIAFGGTVAVNMAFKIAIVLANAHLIAGRLAATSLLASLVILISTLVWRLIELVP